MGCKSKITKKKNFRLEKKDCNLQKEKQTEGMTSILHGCKIKSGKIQYTKNKMLGAEKDEKMVDIIRKGKNQKLLPPPF